MLCGLGYYTNKKGEKLLWERNWKAVERKLQ